MANQTKPKECDTCDEKPINSKPAGNRRLRFLDAYRECGAIAPAARRAGVHRATVHRWRADPVFVAAMRTAMVDYFPPGAGGGGGGGGRAAMLARGERA